jgi:hypothetical protein
MAICVIAVLDVASCQCFSPGGNQITSPSLRANRSPRNLDYDRPRPVRRRIRRPHLAHRRHHRHEHGSFLGRQGQATSPRSLTPGKQMLRRDVMPTGNFRYDRSGCLTATIRPLSADRHRRPTPTRISTPPRRSDVSTIWSTIYANRSPQIRSHLAAQLARCKVGAEHRSDVRSQGPGRTRTTASTGGFKR